MAERELPAIRIRFVGDADGVRKAIADSQKEIQKLVDSVNKIRTSKTTSSTINKTVKAAVKLGEEMIDHSIKNLMNGVLNVRSSHTNITKTIRAAVKLTEEFMVAHIKKLVNNVDTVKVSPAATKKTVREAVELTKTFLISYIRQLVSTVGTVKASPAATKRTVREAVKLAQDFIIYYIKNLMNGVSTIRFNGSEIRSTVRRAVRTMRDFIIYYIQQMVGTLAGMQMSVSTMRAAVRRMIRQVVNMITQVAERTVAIVAIGVGTSPMYVNTARNAIRRTIRSGILAVISAIDLSVRAAIAGMNINSLTRSIAAGIRRAFRNGINRMNNNLNQNNPPQPAPGPRGIGRGDLGNRADIYMHSSALRTLTGAVGSFLQPAAEMEVLKVQMEAFTGSAQVAAETVRQLQEHALVSPYSMQAVTEASTLLQKYGMGAQQSVDVTRMLGDVAGGSNEKLHLLGLAVGQITALGRLQGQELRQLTEHGWNPLVTIANATGKSMAELDDLKRRGMITSEAVIAALRIETAEGGRFHDMQKRMSGTTSGLVQQIREMITVLGTKVVEALDEDIKAALNSVLRFLQGLREWIKENPKAVKEWAHFIKWIVIGIGAFHMLGLAVAYSRWIMHSFLLLVAFGRNVVGIFTAVIGGLTFAVQVLWQALVYLRTGLVMTQLALVRTWLAALGPITPIVILAAAVYALQMAVAALALEFFIPGGLGMAFDWMIEKFKVFFGWLVKITGMTKILQALSFNFPEPKSLGLPALEAPKDLDWNKMLNGAPGGEGDLGGAKGFTPLPAAPAGVRAGSSEHIMRQWEYSQKLGAIRVGGDLNDPEKKKVQLLEQIEANTRKSPASGPDLMTASVEAL